MATPIRLAWFATNAAVTNVTFTNIVQGTTIDLQLSVDERFGFCVCPIYNIPLVNNVDIPGLNQRTTYFARARTRYATGDVDDWSNVITFRTADGTAQSTGPAAVMITPAMIVVPERQLVVSSARTIAGFPPENLLRDAPVAWRARMPPNGAGVPETSIDIDMSGAPFNTIAFLNTNIPEVSTLHIRGFATAADRNSLTNATLASSINFRASANLPGRRGYHGLFQFATSTARFLRFFITGAATFDTFHAEHLVIGLNRVTKNHSVDKTEEPLPRGSVDRSRSGVPDRVDGLVQRKVSFDLSLLTEQQYETQYGDLIYRENEPILVVPNMRSGAFLHDRILYGDLKGSRVFNPASPRYTRSFTIESLI